jgi:hypothetical protein
MRWAGHVACMSFNRERRLLGRLGHGWETNSIIGLKETG